MEGYISSKIDRFMKAGSFIRKMFEEGAAMKARYGSENVFDFSIGNPMGSPPEKFIDGLRKVIDTPIPGKHSYMPNAGYPHVRENLAGVLAKELNAPLEAKHLIMTVGAAGALNVALKSVVNAGETILIFAPFFVEYKFYADNVGAECEVVETDNEFNIDIEAVEKALKPGVKAMIVNTPNNPTGRVYPRETLTALGKLADRKAEEFGHPIYIISDEPYKRIVYGDVEVTSLFDISSNTIICTSYSKELCIPGERLGYIAVNPRCEGAQQIIDAATFCNRILGFVNAPALMQRALGENPGESVDISNYAENRALRLDELTAMGYVIIPPEGAFYLFPRSPIPDDGAFVDELKKEKVLVVPGTGFGRSGYFRISYCVTREAVERALPGFRTAIERVM